MNSDYQEFLFDERLSVYLMVLKITPNLKGYCFFKDCAKKISHDSTKKFNINKKLFNEIATKHQEKTSLVERSLRHAIDVCIKRDGLAAFAKFAKVDFYSEKPSPRELLCILVERAVIESNFMDANKRRYADRWQDVLIG